MDKDAGHIRAQIAETRIELGETVDALAYKTDVKARVGERVNDALHNPFSLVGGAFALGILAGFVLPASRNGGPALPP